MRAEILTIGDELCRGEIVDTNSSGLAQRLWDLDITTRWMTSCCDDENDITTALDTAVNRADVVVCSGGLGPTEDDLTVDVVAKLADQDVIIDETARARMEARFAGRIEVTPIQLRQVRVPARSKVYVNPAGLAPSFEVAIRGVPVICLPGIPRELYAIYDAHLEARFRVLRESRGAAERIARRIYRVFGKGESQISQACRGLVDDVAGASIHYQVKFPETLVKLVVRDHSQEAAQGKLDALDAGVRERLSGFVYGTGEENLVDKVSKRLLAANVTVATAESCTGGMIGELLTAMPGMSKVFKGGAIVYSNEEKTRQLGVSTETLAAHGAVSEETAVEMAEGALERFGVDLAISVTGIAGPDGGTPEKPVGTVWLAAHSASGAVAGGTVHLETITKKLGWPGLRDQIRTLSAWWAFKLIDEMLDRRGSLTMADDKRDERGEPRDERPAGKRLFVGVRVSVQTANALAQACETLQRRAKDAKLDFKWVAPANYHVTLKFLGFTREDAVGAVRDALEKGLAGADPVKFRTARLGAFGSLEKASVLWAGVEAERGGPSSTSPLDDLYARVEKAMTGIGYRPETRPFHAHVTLARLRETRPVRDVVLPLSEQMFSDTRIDGVTLFESETKSSGSVYRDLHRVGFKTAGFPDLATEKRQTEALALGDETQTDTDDGWPRGHGH